jgi:hypothetical protein
MGCDMPDQRGDEVANALDALSDAIERNTGDERLLQGRLAGLRRERAAGTAVTTALEQEPTPGTMELLGRILSRLMEASGNARRALARTMRSEGTSIPAIARVFGVTHQRVSNILSRPAAVPPPILHEAAAAGDPPGDADGGSAASGLG